MEPRAPTPERRLDALRGLAEAGVPSGVMAAPMIPGLNDCELESILEAAANAGARSAAYVVLRLPHELTDLFVEWLETHYPLKAAKVLKRIRALRGGRLNDSRFGRRMRGSGPYADLLQRRFDIARRRLGFARERFRLDESRFRVPRAAGGQGRLFE